MVIKFAQQPPRADEAIRKVEEDRPDLILMDIVLKSKMDGIEAADLITSRFDIPVIYLTAHTNQEYIERAKQTKPFSLSGQALKSEGTVRKYRDGSPQALGR
ncbi:MAG: response regulator [Candidatus Moduliflexus flocculans]|nr:response regulator [Candidatus Moduliflexus flocculans]